MVGLKTNTYGSCDKLGGDITCSILEHDPNFLVRYPSLLENLTGVVAVSRGRPSYKLITVGEK